MATKLKEVDVVIVGLGWTGGILSKELTEAGMKVVALERGDVRSTDKDFAVPNVRDELRYVVRHELMQNAARDTLTVRNNVVAGGAADAAARLVPAGRGRRRFGNALERPHLALDRHGIQGALHVRGALRQEFHPRRHDDPGLGHHLRRARAVLRQVRIHRRGVGQGRQHQGPDPGGRQPVRGAAGARLRAAAADADSGERDVHARPRRTTATIRSLGRPRTPRAPTPIRTAPNTAPASIAAIASGSAARPTPRARRWSR